MRVTTLMITLLVLLQKAFAQNPQVPAKMQFADLQLTITKGARYKIQKEVDKLRRSETYFRKYVNKADLHFPVIEQAFKDEGCPDAIKYLILQETGINAVAVSSSNAVGYWQFKKETGIEQGLKISGGIDERKSIYASSHGAGRYMASNNKRIDNWIYTVMAYNTGVGGAQSHIKDKYRGAKKMEIGSHTHWYVIKFLAHKVAFEQEVGKKQHNQKLLVVAAKSGQTVKQIAKKYKVTAEETKAFNEWIGLSKRIPSDKIYHVVLPVKNDGVKGQITEKGVVAELADTGENYDAQADKLILEIPSVTKRVTINSRPAVIPNKKETIVTLARKGGITQKKFRKYNEIETFSQIIPGMPYFYKAKKRKSKTAYHTVLAGESTWSIAQKYGIREWSLRTKNRMAKTEALVIGRVLWLNKIRPDHEPVKIVPVATPKVVKPTTSTQKEVTIAQPKQEETIEEKVEQVKVEQSTAPAELVVAEIPELAIEKVGKNEYVVQQGDTYYAISRKFDLTVDELKELNNLSHQELAIGQVLVVQKPKETVQNEVASEVDQPEEVFIDYVIKQGDTIYGVSKKFDVSVDDILKWNNKSTNSLSIGETIKIKK